MSRLVITCEEGKIRGSVQHCGPDRELAVDPYKTISDYLGRYFQIAGRNQDMTPGQIDSVVFREWVRDLDEQGDSR